jgi:hypothetical protein
MDQKFDSYAQASAHQLKEWQAGRPWHNPWSPGSTEAKYGKYDGECCPDFSCCMPDMLWPQTARDAFVSAGEETRSRMLFGSLSSLTSSSDATIHVVDEDEHQEHTVQ